MKRKNSLTCSNDGERGGEEEDSNNYYYYSTRSNENSIQDEYDINSESLLSLYKTLKEEIEMLRKENNRYKKLVDIYKTKALLYDEMTLLESRKNKSNRLISRKIKCDEPSTKSIDYNDENIVNYIRKMKQEEIDTNNLINKSINNTKNSSFQSKWISIKNKEDGF
jgi:hypothetical protein